jgi:Uma2 family endonuclease
MVMMSPAGFEHGRIAMAIGTALTNYVKLRGLGVVTGAETGYQIGHDPDTVRAADVGFIRAERVPPELTLGFFDGAPDLAVEVLSPGDRAGEVLAKIQEWLIAGCRAVWLVDPVRRTVSVYDRQDRVVTASVAQEVRGGDVLPGFALPVAEIFA